MALLDIEFLQVSQCYVGPQPGSNRTLVMLQTYQQPRQQQQACSSSHVEAKGENNPTGGSSHAFGTLPSAMGQLSELLNSDQNIFDWALGEASGEPHEQAWLPMEGAVPDIAQDSMKRPPAA